MRGRPLGLGGVALIVTRREFEDAELGVTFAVFGLLHSKFRVFVERREPGLLGDDALFGPVRPTPVERSVLVVTLQGECLIRTVDRSSLLRTGEWLAESRNRGWQVRRPEGGLALLTMEWEPGPMGTRLLHGTGPFALSPRALRELRSHVDGMIASPNARSAARWLALILAQLRSEGLPFDEVAAGDLLETVAPWAPPLIHSVDRLLSNLPERPMMVDLESALGWSRSMIRRRLLSLHQRYSFHAQGGLREVLRNWRLPVAASLMSTAGATTEVVALKVGFQSPASFCEAFANAGLPSPGNIRSALRKLS